MFSRTALVALLLLGFGTALADEKSSSDRLTAAEREIRAAFRSANAVVRGRVRRVTFESESPLGLPATRYEMDETHWLKPDTPGASSFTFYVEGGRAPNGLELIPSKGTVRLEPKRRYVVLTNAAENQNVLDGVYAVSETGRMSDEEGFRLGLDADGRIHRALSALEPTLHRKRRVCVEPPPPQSKLPFGEEGLFASPVEHEPTAISTVSASLVCNCIQRETTSSFVNPFATQSMSCNSSCIDQSESEGVVPWLDRGIEFHLKNTEAGLREEVAAGFRAWNHVATVGGSPPLTFSTESPGDGTHPAFMQDSRSGIVILGQEVTTGPYRLGSNEGKCYLWVDAETGRFVEADVLIKGRVRPSNRERTITHELGHALLHGHECGALTIMVARTSVYVPPGDTGADYARAADYACIRHFLAEQPPERGDWKIRRFCDLATVAGCHVWPGSRCLPIRAHVEGHRNANQVRVTAGEKLKIVGIQVENRGTVPIRKALLTFTLTKRGHAPRVVGRYHFRDPIATWIAASYQIRIPRDMHGNGFRLEWRATHPGRDQTDDNDVAWLSHQDTQVGINIVQ